MRVRAIVAGLLAATIGIAPPVAAGIAVTGDRLLVDSVDDFIGGDVRTELTDADATFQFVNPPLPPSEILVNVSNGDESWTLYFKAPDGDDLEVGHYPDAGVQTPITPEIRISANSNGCGSSRIGSFTIQQLDRDGEGDPVAFAATFEQWCDNSFGPLVGLVRVNSDVPQALLSSPQANRAFGNVTTGESEGPRTFTVESLGELTVEVNDVDVTGSAAVDFPVGDDDCTGASLDTGEMCSFDMTFEPSATGDREADLVIDNDAPQGARVLPVGGYGRIPTSTAVHVEPDTQYINPGIRLVATVTPIPGGSVQCWYDGELLDTGGLSGGSMFCVHERELGSHTFSAKFLGSVFHGDSESAELTFVVSSDTSVELEVSTSTVPAGVPVTFTIDVSTASALLYPGGSVVLRDVTTDQVIATRPIDFGQSTHEVSASFAAGTHEIEAAYEGVDGVLDASDDVVSLMVLPDAVAPTTTQPSHVPEAGTAQSDGRLPVHLSWTGSDNLSGIEHYEVARQLDGGAWSTPWIVTDPTSTRWLRPNHAYRFRVRPIDYAGNTGAWEAGGTFHLERRADYSSAITYLGKWKKSTAGPWFGGTAMTSSTRGAVARFRITGTSFAWIGMFGPGRGRAEILVNGRLVETVSLHRDSLLGPAVAWGRTWAVSKSRIIEVRVLGTPDHPRIDVDAFWFGG